MISLALDARTGSKAGSFLTMISCSPFSFSTCNEPLGM